MLIDDLCFVKIIPVHTDGLGILSLIQEVIAIAGMFGSLILAVACLRIDCAFFLNSTRIEICINFELMT